MTIFTRHDGADNPVDRPFDPQGIALIITHIFRVADAPKFLYSISRTV